MIGEGKATTWKLPGRTFPPGATMDIADSTQTIFLPGSDRGGFRVAALISPDFGYIIVSASPLEYQIHSAITGESFGNFSSQRGHIWSIPDGHHIGDLHFDDDAEIWKITAEGTAELSARGIDISEGRWGCPYAPSRGYRIADGWVFGRSRRRLLILPPLWRSQSVFQERKWSGQFLGLLRGALPEPVIIDLEP